MSVVVDVVVNIHSLVVIVVGSVLVWSL